MKMSQSSRVEKEPAKESLKCVTRKHLAERQRRARINKLLENLETLVLREDPETNPVKLEKAEVLERTVEYVKTLNDSRHKDFVDSYARGFVECMRGVSTFLNNSNMASSQISNIQSYLLSYLTNQQIKTGHMSEKSDSPGCQKTECALQTMYSSNNIPTIALSPATSTVLNELMIGNQSNIPTTMHNDFSNQTNIPITTHNDGHQSTRLVSQSYSDITQNTGEERYSSTMWRPW